MSIAVYLFVILLNLIFAYRKQQSKVVIFISLVTIILLMGGAGPNYSFSTGTADYKNYEIRYNKIDDTPLTSNSQIGFTALMKLGSVLNLNFLTFRLLILAVCIFLIYKFLIKKYSYNSNYILLLYLIYPMIIDSEHLRNFIAMTIFLLGIKFLEEKSARNNIIFLAITLIAVSFHTAFIFYTILVFANSSDRNRLVKFIAFATIVFTLVTVANNNQIPLIHLVNVITSINMNQNTFFGVLIEILKDDRIASYLSSKTSLGFLIPITLHTSSIILVYWSKRILQKKISSIKDNEDFGSQLTVEDRKPENELKFTNLVLWINILGIVFFPLFIMNLHFYRLVRNFLLLNFICYSYASFRLNSGNLYKLIYNVSTLGSLAVWFIMDLSVTTSVERVLIPFFKLNYFF